MVDHPIALDHNGTTPIAPEVAKAMWPYLTVQCGNPSSASPSGRAARAGVEEAREHLAGLIGAHPDEIVFTSGGTEANNLALRGCAAALAGSGGRTLTEPRESRRVLTSLVEHPAVVEPLALLARHGWEVARLDVDTDGRVRLPERIADRTGGEESALGTLILGQNEVGTIQPVAEFAALVHGAGGIVHTDAAQAVGKIPVDVNALGVDLLSVAGHKLYAPKGVGALYVRRGTPIEPVLRGAGQERGLRPGTENVASIVGLGRAAQLAIERITDDAVRLVALRERLWQKLSATAPGTVRISPDDGCLPGTLMVSVPGALGREVLAQAPQIEASTGSACHAGVDSPAETLLSMGLDTKTALGAVRLSLGRATTQEDIDTAAQALADAVSAASA